LSHNTRRRRYLDHDKKKYFGLSSSLRPVVTQSSEAWTLTTKDEKNLHIFERQIIRKIFGPVDIDNIWRIRNDM
jgi:hypothetical protein